MTPVPFWKNPTLLTNAILLAVLAALTVLADHPTWDRAAWLAVGLAVVNVLLQFVGTPPLPGSPAARKQADLVEAVQIDAIQKLNTQFQTVQRVQQTSSGHGVNVQAGRVGNVAGHSIYQAPDPATRAAVDRILDEHDGTL